MDSPAGVFSRRTQDLAQAAADRQFLARLHRHGDDLQAVCAWRLRIAAEHRRDETRIGRGEDFDSRLAFAQLAVAVGHCELPSRLVPLYGKGRIAVAAFGNLDARGDSGHGFYEG